MAQDHMHFLAIMYRLLMAGKTLQLSTIFVYCHSYTEIVKV